MIDGQEIDLVVLHAIRIKGFVDESGLCEITEHSRAVIDAALARQAFESLVTYREGRIAGWGLTPKGRETHRALLSAEIDSSGCRPLLMAAYQRFTPINGAFKQVCTDWQLRRAPGGEPVANDHSDEAYDQSVIHRLKEVDAQIGETLAALAPIRRFGRYLPRLEQALARVEAGDASALTRPMSNSYHDVWMELHEDLLVSLDRSRSEADGH
jgi:hypothetical protein